METSAALNQENYIMELELPLEEDEMSNFTTSLNVANLTASTSSVTNPKLNIAKTVKLNVSGGWFQLPTHHQTETIITQHSNAQQSSTFVELGKQMLLAAGEGNTEQVKALLSKGAPFTGNWLGMTPLHAASQGGHVETVEMLLKAGLFRDAKTKVERTPLQLACQNGHAAVAELLLNAGVDVNARDMLQMDSLHWACSGNHIECARLLLEHGVSPSKASKFDLTPLDLARRAANYQLEQLLIEHGAVDFEHCEEAQKSQRTLATAKALSKKLTKAINKKLTQGVPNSASAAATAVEKSPVKVPPTPHQPLPASSEIYIQDGLDLGSLEDVEDEAYMLEKLTSIASIAEVAAAAGDNGDETLEMLAAHGIRLLPPDDSSLSMSAIEAGGTLTLTTAGKMALEQSKSKPEQSNVTNGASKSKPVAVNSVSKSLKQNASDTSSSKNMRNSKNDVSAYTAESRKKSSSSTKKSSASNNKPICSRLSDSSDSESPCSPPKRPYSRSSSSMDIPSSPERGVVKRIFTNSGAVLQISEGFSARTAAVATVRSKLSSPLNVPSLETPSTSNHSPPTSNFEHSSLFASDSDAWLSIINDVTPYPPQDSDEDPLFLDPHHLTSSSSSLSARSRQRHLP